MQLLPRLWHIQLSSQNQMVLIKSLQSDKSKMNTILRLAAFTPAASDIPKYLVIILIPCSLDTFFSKSRRRPSMGLWRRLGTSSNMMLISSTGIWKLLVSECQLSHKAHIMACVTVLYRMYKRSLNLDALTCRQNQSKPSSRTPPSYVTFLP